MTLLQPTITRIEWHVMVFCKEQTKPFAEEPWLTWGAYDDEGEANRVRDELESLSSLERKPVQVRPFQVTYRFVQEGDKKQLSPSGLKGGGVI